MADHLIVTTISVNPGQQSKLTSDYFLDNAVSMNHCQLCSIKLHTTDQLYCSDCLKQLPFIDTHCRSCAHPTHVDLAMCGYCQKKPFHFDRAFSIFKYHHPLRDLILQFKANKLPNPSQLHQWLFSAYYHQLELLPEQNQATSNTRKSYDGIIAVPSGMIKTIKRGYVPSYLLAQELSKRTGIPFIPNVFTKRFFTPSQKRLTKGSRQKKNKFKYHQQALKKLSNIEKVLLIDDVMTTGASLNELAKTLKASGIQQVDALTIARTPRTH